MSPCCCAKMTINRTFTTTRRRIIWICLLLLLFVTTRRSRIINYCDGGEEQREVGDGSFVWGFVHVHRHHLISSQKVSPSTPSSPSPFWSTTSSSERNRILHLLASPSSSSSSSSVTKKKKNKKNKKNKKKKHSKPNQRHLVEQQQLYNNNNNSQNNNNDRHPGQHTDDDNNGPHHHQRSSRPILTDYHEQRSLYMTDKRLSSSSDLGRIECEHFEGSSNQGGGGSGGCPGCVVNQNVGSVDIIDVSSRQYFHSPSVRRHRIDDANRSNNNNVRNRSGGGGGVDLTKSLRRNRRSMDNDWEEYDDDNDYYDDDYDYDDDDGFYNVVVPSPVTQWRTQAKLVAANKGNSQWSRDGCVFGLYQRGSHVVLPIPNCQVHHPAINDAIRILQQATTNVGTVAANDGTGGSFGSGGNNNHNNNGGLRYVQLQVERTTNRIQLTLVWSASQLKDAQPSLTRLVKQIQKLAPDMWHSIWCHCNDGPGNNIFSRNPRNWHRLVGPEFVREPIPVGIEGWLYFSPLCFRQGNLDGFDVIANDVARAIPGGSKVCELYAGVGLLGLTSLAYHHNRYQDGDDDDYDDEGDNNKNKPLVWVRCSDENPSNPRCFSRSVRSLPQEMTQHDAVVSQSSSSKTEELTFAEIMERMKSGEQTFDDEDDPQRTGPKATYMVASAGEALRAGQALGADVLIVDPPRKGLEDDVLDELCKPFNPRQPMVESANMLTVEDDLVHWTNDVNRLIYVSCGFDALARDCDRLLSSPAGWKLESATGYVLFPGSNHVETLCVFQRK